MSDCHRTKAANALLDAYAIDTPDGRVWNAQLHDMVDNIERQATDEWRTALRVLQENWPRTVPAPMDAPR